MLNGLRRLWRSRDWMLIPLAAIAILAAAWWVITEVLLSRAETRTYHIDWQVDPGDRAAGPTTGMVVEESGYGTVMDVPTVQAPMTGDEGGGPFSEPSIAPDVARFVRALPREVRTDPAPAGPIVCTLEGLPRYAGRLVLVDGCLRFHHDGEATPGPLVLAPVSLARDKENYLAVGPTDAPPEYRLRVGEPGGVFLGVGCSRDGPVPAPEDLARQCGVDRMIRLGTIKRKPLCSPAYLNRRDLLRREERETAGRLQRAHDACVARTGSQQECPPAAFPPNIELFDPPCRLPPGTD